MATLDKDDLLAIKNLVDASVQDRFDEIVSEKIGLLPTRDEYYTKIDEVVGEIKKVREEQPLQAARLLNHEDRLEKIESHLGITSN